MGPKGVIDRKNIPHPSQEHHVVFTLTEVLFSRGFGKSRVGYIGTTFEENLLNAVTLSADSFLHPQD